MTKVETMKCPFCKSDAKGNEAIKFLCLNCNILFEKHHLDGDIFNNKYEHMDPTYMLFENHR